MFSCGNRKQWQKNLHLAIVNYNKSYHIGLGCKPTRFVNQIQKLLQQKSKLSLCKRKPEKYFNNIEKDLPNEIYMVRRHNANLFQMLGVSGNLKYNTGASLGNNYTKEQFHANTKIVNSQEFLFSLAWETPADILILEIPERYFDCNITGSTKHSNLVP